MGPFKIINKVTEISYRLDLPPKMKIHLVYHIAMLKPVYGNYKSPVYEQETTQEPEENLKHSTEKAQEYYQKLHQAILRKKG